MVLEVVPVPTSATEDRALCGWRVASALPLPDLLPWTGDDRMADLVIELGPVPERVDDSSGEPSPLQVAADGACRVQVPDVATYFIDPAGRRVVIDPVMPPQAPDIRLFLLGTVFSILCFRRGLLPLPASCVRVGEGAIALAGPSGMGKSTLAATLLRRGHAVLADDVTVLDFYAPGGPRVLPAFPRLKLWRDAMARLSLPVEGLERSRAVLDKYHVPVGDAFCAQSLPLSAVFHLDTSRNPDDGLICRLRGPEAVAWMGRDVYRSELMRWLGLSPRFLPRIVTATAVEGGTWVVSHGHDHGGLERSIAGILDRVCP